MSLVETSAPDVGGHGHELGVGMTVLEQKASGLGRMYAAAVEAEAFGMRATVLRVVDEHPAQYIAVG